ncbi:MAG: vancomycin resistance protein [Candidatus Magasanikbacteria bacterium RIFOXYC12_FULL_33_11]|uniref:Vancomycin resistance protein n=1 Tax=Candidatus Magasanikbacteria bacterium RIFOXYC12_FULL_33_11 TaxID=1798701 RepID=A0A1F6NRX5_9BACT|nr:MAG: vancomycin resistance protein [Candidatus Magasanikbacteria bacterium RIFOXYC12_FULL_33_11]
MKEPKHRSKSRILAGKIYYNLKKHFDWYLSGEKFTKKFESPLAEEIFTHKTVLRRKLKDVDIWMQENKIKNLKIAIQKLDKIVLNPGETLSYWRQIKNPTKNKGYLPGMVLHDGQVLSGTGGGLCQLSNLIYWMTLHTPLTVVERWRHSYDVFPDVKRNQPFGSGATCAYPYIDLQIKNNTNQKFQLSLELNEKYLIGKWLSNKPIDFSYEIFEKKHTIKQEWWGGYVRSNEIFRKIFDKNKKEIKEELITKNEAIMMYNPLLENK